MGRTPQQVESMHRISQLFSLRVRKLPQGAEALGVGAQRASSRPFNGSQKGILCLLTFPHHAQRFPLVEKGACTSVFHIPSVCCALSEANLSIAKTGFGREWMHTCVQLRAGGLLCSLDCLVQGLDCFWQPACRHEQGPQIAPHSTCCLGLGHQGQRCPAAVHSLCNQSPVGARTAQSELGCWACLQAAPVGLLGLWHALASIWRLVVHGMQSKCQLQLSSVVIRLTHCRPAQLLDLLLLLTPMLLPQR